MEDFSHTTDQTSLVNDSNEMSSAAATPINENLQIIAQPLLSSRLRYRSELRKNKHRRATLHSENNPNYSSPTIWIPTMYFNLEQQFHIRVCLVTIFFENINGHYIHPYDLEDTDVDQRNDRQNKAVWYPIEFGDVAGMKSFPNLRIVRKKHDELINHGPLQVLDCPGAPVGEQCASTKDTRSLYQLQLSQLAFTIGQKIHPDEPFPRIISVVTTVYSDVMVENLPQESPTVSTIDSSLCQIYKYAPTHGFVDGNEEILIFLDKKHKTSRYGDLEVTFSFDTYDGQWTSPGVDLEVRDQMISFKTPQFPFPITEPTRVDLILRQRRREFPRLDFVYKPRDVQCSSCRWKSSNKRSIDSVLTEEDNS